MSALKPVKPLPLTEMVKTSRGTAMIADRPVKDDIARARWFGTGTGKDHAFLVPDALLTAKGKLRANVSGKVRALCPASKDAAALTDGKGDRCKLCVKAMGEMVEPKYGTGLSEPSTELVATGLVDGAPREAEARRQYENLQVSGDAAKDNAAIVEALREGDRERAMTLARALDARGPATEPPSAWQTPRGQRDMGMLDGVALVQGPNMKPEQPTWHNPVTHEDEPAAAYLGGSLKERADRTVVSSWRNHATGSTESVPMGLVGEERYGSFARRGGFAYLTQAEYAALSRSQQRKYWARLAKMAAYAKAQRKAGRRAVRVPLCEGTGGVGTRALVDPALAQTERLMRGAPGGNDRIDWEATPYR